MAVARGSCCLFDEKFSSVQLSIYLCRSFGPWPPYAIFSAIFQDGVPTKVRFHGHNGTA